MKNILVSLPNLCVVLYLIVPATSCDTFLAVEPPVSKIPANLVFADDAAANSAVIGMYIGLAEQPSFAAGSTKGILMCAGLSADELINLPKTDHLYLDFEKNNLNALNSNVLSLWGSLYKSIYTANAILEGISTSSGMSDAKKEQFRGESLFIRGFCYFYLTNLFGEVPLILTTNYKTNSRLTRISASSVYDQIKADLTEAESLLLETYEATERIRVNKYAATALLARVYLYTNDFPRAEDKATTIINETDLYSLTSLTTVFLANSREAIWQIRPLTQDPLTNEANMFSLFSARDLNALNPGFVRSFNSNDNRKSVWIASYAGSTDTLWLPSKYKRITTGSSLPNEYSMVLRLAEIYLIRAEARVMQDKLNIAIADVDTVRARAGLTRIANSYPEIKKHELVLLIENERKFELFTEWGHRWFDLNRTGRSSTILGSIKQEWSNDDMLYPIPETEINNNEMLKPQNPGY